MKIKETFEVGTDFEDIIDFIHDNMEDDYEKDKIQKETKITIERAD